MLSDPDLLSGRLFFGVPVPGTSREPLEAVLPELGQVLPAARWTSPSGWHLTLAFLGHVRPEFSAEVVTVGEGAVAGLGPVRLRLDGAGGFPSQRRARVVWAGLSGDVEVLVALASRLAAGCKEAGLPFEGSDTVADVAEPIIERFSTGEYPHLVEMATEYYLRPGYDFGDEFEWGLELILEGLDRRR